MMFKYIVPDKFKKIYMDDIIYCKVLNTTEVNNIRVHLVKMLNNNQSNVFAENELKRLNLIDRIKVLKYRRKNVRY